MGAARRPAPSRPAPRQAASPSRPASTHAPAQQTASTTPAPMQQSSGGGGGMLSGIGSTIAQGMAFGTGSAIAHRAVGAVAGSMSGGGGGEAAPVEAGGYDQQQQQKMQSSQQPQGACSNDKQMFYECLQVNRGDQEACKFLYQQLQECQQSATTMSFQ